jgi:penicillin-binding protein 2
MTSLPSFDPNWSASGRVAPEHLPNLEEFNRVIQGLYIPGSTYKMMTAIATLEEGVANESGRVTCTGGYRIGNSTIGCWVGAPGHGSVDMVGAIKRSCNVYFLEMGARLRAKARAAVPDSGLVDILTKYAPDFGLDAPTGIDLPFERAGRSPVTAGRRWFAGEDIQVAIGQSRQEYSPIQLAVYTATVATGGVRMRPYLVEEILKEGETIWRAQPERQPNAQQVSAHTYEIVRQGMLAVTEPGGTAYSAFWDIPIRVAAKTGTAQTATRPNDGLFVGFAPYDDPQIAWAIVVKHGDTGSLSGAPVARELVRTYFGLNQPVDAGAGQ